MDLAVQHRVGDQLRRHLEGQVPVNEQIELRVGKASIVMKKDGHITIRGTYLVSHASAANRIRHNAINN